MPDLNETARCLYAETRCVSCQSLTYRLLCWQTYGYASLFLVIPVKPVAIVKKPVYYRGIRAIAERLDISPVAALRLQQDFALPLYREMLHRHAAVTWRWVIDEPAIVAWQLWRSRCDRAYDALLNALGDQHQAKRYGLSAHARTHYMATMTRYRQLLLEQASPHNGTGKKRFQQTQEPPALTSEVDLDLSMFHVKPDGETSD